MIKTMRQAYCLLGIIAMCVAGCSPSSLEDFRVEGESQLHALAKELKKIETREELLKAEPNLRKKFNSLVQLILAARSFQLENPDADDARAPFSESEYSEELRQELMRIYSIEGGREVIEKAQREALFNLTPKYRNAASDFGRNGGP